MHPLLLAAPLVFPFVQEAEAPARPPAGAPELAPLLPWIEEAVADWGVPGLALALVTSDEVLYLGGFGVRAAGQAAAVDGHTAFAVGSVSKTFAGFGVARAVERGELEWDEPLVGRLPELAAGGADFPAGASLRDALAHRLGLPAHDLMWYGRPERTEAELLAGIGHLARENAARPGFRYSNLGYFLVGQALERATGRVWADWIEGELAPELGLVDTQATLAGLEALANRAVGHRPNAEDQAVATRPRSLDRIGPAGSLASSAHDLARWARLHLDGGRLEGERHLEAATVGLLHGPRELLPEQSQDEMMGLAAYAHGWIIDSYRGHARAHHGGNTDGFTAALALFPDDDFAVVALCNLEGSAVPEYVVRRAADLRFGLEPRGWSEGDLDQRKRDRRRAKRRPPEPPVTPRVAGTTHDHPLEAYALAFEHPAYGRLEIEREAEGLRLRLGELTGALEHWHFETFRVERPRAESAENPLFGSLVTFRTSALGELEALEVALEPRVAAQRFVAAFDPRLRDPRSLAEFAGEYSLLGNLIAVELRGSGLVAVVEGEQDQVLIGDRNDTFRLRNEPESSMRFLRDNAGRVEAVELRQPQGTLVAKRRAPDSE